jgi:hypothetical protein
MLVLGGCACRRQHSVPITPVWSCHTQLQYWRLLMDLNLGECQLRTDSGVNRLYCCCFVDF